MKLTETGLLPQISIDYINEEDSLKGFYHYSPKIDSFADAIKNKSFSEEKRRLLSDVLFDQYKDSELSISESTISQIESIKSENTYTVTTGHQLSIFTGPLYFIYKIVTAINLAKQLNEKYSDKHFVPVFWMASEDHDFEEISSINLFGKEIKWNKLSHQQPVGRLNLDGLKEDMYNIELMLGSKPKSKHWSELLESSYNEKYNLSQATRRLVHQLFADEGLLIIDADNAKLKKELKPIIKADILEQQSFTVIQKTNEELSKTYKLQINGRELNFFYLHNELGRKLIRPEGDEFKLQDTDIVFTKDEIENLIESKPELFSPNVVLRPVYQELILPNLAYIGGPAEVAYWLQLKSVFNSYDVPYPVVMLRNSFLLLGSSLKSKIEKSGLQLTDFFLNESVLLDKFVKIKSESNFQTITQQIEDLFQKLIDEAKAIDNQLGKEILETKLSTKDFFNKANKTFKKQQELKLETDIEKLLKTKSQIFPNGVFQERKENIMTYDINTEKDIIDLVLEKADAFSQDLIITDL
jgi:bacillithiol biosynthesis cysteine-adding enzyme BshC